MYWWRPGGLVLRLADEAAESVPRGDRGRTQSAIRHLRLGGGVLSDATLENLKQADPVSAAEINAAFNHWDDIDIHIGGRTIRSGGHGFIGIGRKRLLNILQARCEALGVKLVFETDVSDDQALARQYNADLVIASDGLNSRIRTRYAELPARYRHAPVPLCRLGTHKLFDAFTFAFEKTEHGWFQAHAYRFDDNTSTFIVEAPEPVWKAAGIEQMSQEEGVATARSCSQVPRRQQAHQQRRASARLGDLDSLPAGDLPSLGALEHPGRRPPRAGGVDGGRGAYRALLDRSGTKLALEDAIDLAMRSASIAPPVSTACPKRWPATRPRAAWKVLKIQNAARNSTEWFENVERYAGMAPEQFAYSLLTRSQRISHENLRVRDAQYVDNFEQWLAAQAGVPQETLKLARGCRRCCSAADVHAIHGARRHAEEPRGGEPDGDVLVGRWRARRFPLVHLGSRALGGAGMVVAEMTCVSPDARITPACPGLWNDGAARCVEAHRRLLGTPTAIRRSPCSSATPGAGIDPAWLGEDGPPAGGRKLAVDSRVGVAVHARCVAGATRNDAEDMDRVRDDFVANAKRAAEAGFDWLELHCAHGYLLSSFISPLTNTRTDAYGGSLANRLRYPLEVFAAVRAGPQDKPMSVRISAHDWVEGGITADDGGDRTRLQGGRRGHDRLFIRPGQPGSGAGLRPDVPDAILRPHPQ
jgi:anthraniloyl-CoA monooxygenase